MNSGVKKLFLVNLTVADGGGPVLDDEEWWRGAWLATNDTSGTLTVANPFGQGDIPDDAELTLEVGGILGQDNPFADFIPLTWTAESAASLADPIRLTAPTNSGAAAFTLTLTSDKYGLLGKDRFKVNVGSVNLIIDSLNQYGYDVPVDSEEVAEIEDDPDEPGKIIVVNDGDADLDGIPGFADGYGLFDLPEYQVSTNSQFVPVIFELPKPIDFERASVKLTYDASDPLGVTTNSTGEHLLPESGKLRLWTRDGGEPRGGKAVIDGGDFLSAGEYSAAEFGFTNESSRTLTYYIEALKPSEEVGDLRILFEVQPDERTGFMAVDAVRLTSLQMQFIIPDADGGKRPTLFVPVSDPCPVVTLGALLPEDVTISGDTATFKVSGTVADAIADIMPDNLADIASVRLLIDGEEHIAPTALAAGDGGAPTFWRRHPFRGVFNELQVSLPARGSHIVTVETAENAAGRKGWQGLALNFHSAAEEFFGGTNFMANIHIATNLTNTMTDTIQFFHGDGGPYEDDPRLVETGAATLVFTGRLDEVGIEINISSFSGLSTNVDSFMAELRYNISTNYQPVYSNLFVETSATSGLFRCASAFTVARGDLTVAVVALGGTLPGSCVPTVERIKGPADLLGNGDFTLTFMGAEYALEEEDGWFYPKGGSPRDVVVVPDPSDPSAALVITYGLTADYLLRYSMADWKLKSMLNWKTRQLYATKVAMIRVDLDIDSGNTAGTGVPPRTPEVDAIEEMSGEAYPGKILYMNDMDVDGDGIPDFLDGFGRIDPDDVKNGEDLNITDGTFIPLMLDCQLPAGLDPSIAQIKFVYDANDPGAIAPMSLAASQAYATNAREMNPLAGRIRIWTKDASETRNPASVAENGDFVPPEIMLPYESVMTGAVTRIYVEGIGTSPAWGGDKIKVQVYPCGEGHGCVEDQVSYTVVRCVYKVCVYRPYICLRNAAGAITNRVVFRTDYSSPSNMVASYFAGQAQFDDSGSFHELAAFMGHAFACVESRTPKSSGSPRLWTGQTGLECISAVKNSYSALKNGVAWWYRANDGREDDAALAEQRYQNLYMAPSDIASLYDPVSGCKRRMIAVREFRLPPKTMQNLLEYRTKHPFSGYGLDTDLNTAHNSRVGCGSYIGLLTEYAGVDNIEPWVFDKKMPVIELPSIKITWVGEGIAYRLYKNGFNGALRRNFRKMGSEAMSDLAKTPDIQSWGASTNTLDLRFCDPGWMMDWVDQQNLSTRWAHDRGVTIRYESPAVSDLKKWKNRHEQ